MKTPDQIKAQGSFKVKDMMNSIQQHGRVPAGETPVTCPKCGKLTYTIQLHTGETTSANATFCCETRI